MSRRAPGATGVAGLVTWLAAASCNGPETFVDRETRPWRLAWADEFEGAAGTPPDASRWKHDIGGGGWGNAQLEFDTDSVDNAALDGEGHLAIVARKDGARYTSARLTTEGLMARAHGRFEARVRLPRGAGLWPAFWLLGADYGAVGWPRCGEIDVMEYRGQVEDLVQGSLHGPGYSGGNPVTDVYELAPGESFADDFHVFAVEWDPGRIAWWVDGELYQVATGGQLPAGAAWVFEHPFFVILNLAVGGTYVGSPDATTPFPATMLVDWVRVYEREP